MTINSLETPTRQLTLEAARWRLLSLLLERPRSGWRDEVRELAAIAGLENLRAAAECAQDADEGTYLSLFGENGFASPREITYLYMQDPGQIMGDLAGFYTAFAYKPQQENTLDHIATEAGFVGYLFLKEAAALNDQQPERARLVRDARNKFIDAHLKSFAQSWAERVRSTGVAYLSATAAALLEALE